MGKGGVLWGRLVMLTQELKRVIYWRNRTIYRRQVTSLTTCRNERGFFLRHSVRLTRTQRYDLALTRAHIREESKFARTILVARRGRYGVRTDSLFSIETNRNRQSRPNSSSGHIVIACWNRTSSVRAWSRRPFGSSEPRELECKESREFSQASRHHEASETKQWFKRGGRMNVNNSISIAEQGCSAYKGSSVMDDTTTLIEVFAAKAAKHESRTTLLCESICTDARY